MTAAFRAGAAAPAGPAQAVSALLASVLSLLRMILSDASEEKRRRQSFTGSERAGLAPPAPQVLRVGRLVAINAVAGALRRH
jgi:hypothetical protein